MKIIDLNVDIKEIDKIFHIADIHVRPYKRHSEYRHVFDKLYKSIKDNATENSIIVLLGDIVHSKTEMSPELIDIVSDLFNNLSNIAYTIIVPGNHDANLNNKNRLDAISPIIKNIKSDRLFYFKNSGVYKFGNIYFSNMSVFDDIKSYVLADKIETSGLKIALYHGVVNNAVNKFGYKFKSDTINTNFFNGFDLVLLGDIHATQFLKHNIAYPGSLIQQNHGEDLNRGYILWNLKDFSGQFIKIENDYGYYTLEIRSENIPHVNDIPKKCKLRINSYDIENSKLDKIIYEIKKKYNPIEVTINRINSIIYPSSGSSAISILDNITDINYQNKLIENFLINNFNLSEDITNEIKLINTQLNANIEIEEILKNVKWSLIRFEWSNMFSYGENNYVDFSDMRGSVGIFSPNATGKSSFIDALTFCLFDKASKDFKPINIMNNKSDRFNCKAIFELSNVKYFIERTVWLNKAGNPMYKVNFGYYDVDGNEKSLNGENRWETNKNIYSKIGTFEDFILTSFSMQGKNSNFIQRGHSDRKDLIIQFMGLGFFDKLYNIASEKFKELNMQLKNLELDDWKDKLIKSENLYQKYNKIYQEKNKELYNINVEISDIYSKIKNIESQLIDIDEDLSIDELNKTKNEYISLSNKLKEKLNSINNVIEKENNLLFQYTNQKDIFDALKIEELYNEVKLLEDNKKEIEIEMNSLKIKIDNEIDKMNKLTELEYDPNCYYCMNNIFVKDAIATKKLLEEHRKYFDQLKHKHDNITEIINTKADIKHNYEEYENMLLEINNLKLSLYEKSMLKNEMENNIEKNNKNLEYIETKINKYYYLKESIEFNKKINNDISVLNEKINKLKNVKKQIEDDILDYYSKMKIEESNINLYNSNIDKLNSLKIKSECYKYYMAAVKRDGIPYDLISKAVPMLETEINNILNQIVDFTIVIDLDESKNINMYIVYDDENYWILELASGMEQFISSIAIRVALNNISHLPRANFLIIDEGWGTLDSENLNSISALLDYLKTQFSFIIIISHIDQIKESVDGTIEIKVNDNRSIIQHPF